MPLLFSDLNKNKFRLKLSKNGWFAENKVLKINNKKFCPMKYKRFTPYGFHIDFQFWAKKWSLRGSQTTWHPRYQKIRPSLVWFYFFFNFSFFLGNFYINWHCLVVPEMMWLHFLVNLYQFNTNVNGIIWKCKKIDQP